MRSVDLEPAVREAERLLRDIQRLRPQGDPAAIAAALVLLRFWPPQLDHLNVHRKKML